MKTSTVQVNRIPAWQRLWQAATAWLLPGRCAICSARCDDPAALCAACRGDLVANLPCCALCAEPLVQTEPACGRCLRHTPPFVRSYAPLRYAWPLDGLVARFKFSGDLAAGRTLARLFLEHAGADAIAGPRLLVPVPLHRQRLRIRGYDQALELARDIAPGMDDVRLLPDLLRRVRATDAQTTLDAAGRRRNVRAAFAVDARTLAALGTQRPALALLDDVMTTGSTLAECARVLTKAGFTHVEAWAIARAPARD